MDNLNVYKTWAPDDALWTDWAKPVLFMSDPGAYKIFELPSLRWLGTEDRSAAIIVDLPSADSVLEGLALARLGYRPVPLYNGVFGYGMQVIKVRDLTEALFWGAGELARLSLRPDATPVFLLDANRMKGFGDRPGTFDNRWSIFPQDMPSGSFLLGKGIHTVIVRTDQIQTDLSHILCRYQEAGIQILQCDGERITEANILSRPWRFKSLLYRFQVIARLRRNYAGGFGGMIPEPSSRHYGHG